MSQDCLFCKIVRGEIPCAKLLENEKVLAFLDISPVKKGHALVIPKDHHPTLWDLPEDLGAALLDAMKRVSRAMADEVDAQGLNVMMNNLEPAGQLVDHAHFHLVPRHEGDGLELWPQSPYDDQSEMNELADKIRSRIT